MRVCCGDRQPRVHLIMPQQTTRKHKRKKNTLTHSHTAPSRSLYMHCVCLLETAQQVHLRVDGKGEPQEVVEPDSNHEESAQVQHNHCSRATISMNPCSRYYEVHTIHFSSFEIGDFRPGFIAHIFPSFFLRWIQSSNRKDRRTNARTPRSNANAAITHRSVLPSIHP